MAQTYKIYQIETEDPEKLLIKALERVVMEYGINAYSDGISYIIYDKNGKPLVSISMGDLLIRE
jgi:hypothetical protein